MLTLVITRFQLFHNAYIHHHQTIEDESWLLDQCQDPAFYANLKQHVKLCTEVQENKLRSSYLVALNETMSATSMCGTVACMDLIKYVRDGGLSIATTVAIMAVIMVIIVLPLVNLGLRIIGEHNYFIDSNYPSVENAYSFVQTPPTLQYPSHAIDSWYTSGGVVDMQLVGGGGGCNKKKN